MNTTTIFEDELKPQSQKNSFKSFKRIGEVFLKTAKLSLVVGLLAVGVSQISKQYMDLSDSTQGIGNALNVLSYDNLGTGITKSNSEIRKIEAISLLEKNPTDMEDSTINVKILDKDKIVEPTKVVLTMGYLDSETKLGKEIRAHNIQKAEDIGLFKDENRTIFNEEMANTKSRIEHENNIKDTGIIDFKGFLDGDLRSEDYLDLIVNNEVNPLNTLNTKTKALMLIEKIRNNSEKTVSTVKVNLK